MNYAKDRQATVWRIASNSRIRARTVAGVQPQRDLQAFIVDDPWPCHGGLCLTA